MRTARALGDLKRWRPPSSCAFCIKVFFVLVLLARSHMSVDMHDFGRALLQACQVRWLSAAAGRGGGHGTASCDQPAERLIPDELVSWGPNKRQRSTDAIARWLTGGRKLPITVQFAQVSARGFKR